MSTNGLVSRGRDRLKALPRQGLIAAGLVGMLAIAVGLLKYGISLYSGWGNLFEVTQNFKSPELDPSQDFVLPNAGFAAFLGWVGVRSTALWISIHVLLVVAALIAPFLMPRIRSHEHLVRVMFVVVVGGPILPVLLEWVGSYDSLTVLGLVLAALGRKNTVRIVGWTLVGVGHVELGFVAAALLIAYTAVNAPREDRIRKISVDALVAAGPLFVMFILTSALVATWGGASSRIDLALANPIDNAYKFSLVMPAMLFSVLGVLWLVLLRPREIRRRRTWSLVLIVMGISLTLPFLFHDHTRVLGILSLPLTLVWIVSQSRRQADLIWSRFAVAAVIIPIPVFVAGTVMFGGLINFLTWRVVTG